MSHGGTSSGMRLRTSIGGITSAATTKQKQTEKPGKGVYPVEYRGKATSVRAQLAQMQQEQKTASSSKPARAQEER